jgi:hypothetical protein
MMLFKCLLINSKFDVVNDASLLCRKLTKALELIHNLGHSVTQFNIAYRGLLSQLAQQGQTFPDRKTFIEEAYLDHPNEQFARCIQAQQDSDRENPPGNTAEAQMNKVQAKNDQLEIL